MSTFKTNRISIAEFALFIYAFVTVFFKTIPSIGLYTRYFGYMLLIAFAVDLLRDRRHLAIKPLELRLLVPWVGFLIVLFYHGLASPELRSIVFSLIQTIVLFILCFRLMYYRGRAEPIILGLFCGFVALMPYVLMNRGMMVSTGGADAQQMFFSVSDDAEGGMNPNVMGTWLNMGLSLFMYLFVVKRFQIRSRVVRMAYLWSLLGFYAWIAFLVLIVLGSRQSQVYFVINSVAMIVLFTRARINIQSVVLSIGAATFLSIPFIYFLVNSPFFKRFEQMYLYLIGGNTVVDYSIMYRIDMIIKAISMFFERPIVGFGPYGFMLHSGFFAYSHNHYAELLSCYGFIGASSFIALYLSIIYMSFKLVFWGWSGMREIGVWGLFSMTGLMFSHMARPADSDKYYYIFLSVVLAIIAKNYSQYRRGQVLAPHDHRPHYR